MGGDGTVSLCLVREMQIATLEEEDPWFSLPLLINDCDIIKVSECYRVSMLHSKRWSKSFALSVCEPQHFLGFPLSDKSRVPQERVVQGWRAALSVCCLHQGHPCILGIMKDTAGTGPFGPSSLTSCLIWSLGLTWPAQPASDLRAWFLPALHRGSFHLPGLERGFNPTDGAITWTACSDKS